MDGYLQWLEYIGIVEIFMCGIFPNDLSFGTQSTVNPGLVVPPGLFTVAGLQLLVENDDVF